MHRALLLVHLALKDKSQNYSCLFFKKFCTQLFIFFCVPSSCFATFFLITQHLFCAFLRLLLPPTQPSASSSSCFFLLLRDLGIRSSSPCDVFSSSFCCSPLLAKTEVSAFFFFYVVSTAFLVL